MTQVVQDRRKFWASAINSILALAAAYGLNLDAETQVLITTIALFIGPILTERVRNKVIKVLE